MMANTTKRGQNHVLHRRLQSTQMYDHDPSVPTWRNDGVEPQPLSNLHCFLQQTTPMVPIHHLSKRSLHCAASQQLQPGHFYFSLCDLWERFDEWSAYGAGVPIVVDGVEAVTQYFVPYLSAIQLYSSSFMSHELTNSRRLGDDSDGSTESDFGTCSSELSCTDSEGAGKMRDCGTDCTGLEEPWSPTASTGSYKEDCDPETLLFQFFESRIPAVRVPLYENIKDLSKQFPALRTLCSNNLSHSSWMSVAWYPIYRIPTGVTLRHFSTCFLTYHSLSTSFMSSDDRGLEVHSKAAESVRLLPVQNQVALEPFGLASLKFKHTIWMSAREAECMLLIQQLQEGADTWVQQLNISHPDLKYFMSRGAHRY